MDFTQYTREGLAQRKKDNDAALNVTKLKFYRTFLKSWDSKQFGVMTPARFWSRFTHLKQEEDFLELRKHYAWCEKKGVPFAPYVWKKYTEKKLSTDSSHSR